MSASPFRADAVVFLAVLLDTTPEIVLTCAADSNTAEAMHQRGERLTSERR